MARHGRHIGDEFEHSAAAPARTASAEATRSGDDVTVIVDPGGAS